MIQDIVTIKYTKTFQQKNTVYRKFYNQKGIAKLLSKSKQLKNIIKDLSNRIINTHNVATQISDGMGARRVVSKITVK